MAAAVADEFVVVLVIAVVLAVDSVAAGQLGFDLQLTEHSIKKKKILIK